MEAVFKPQGEVMGQISISNQILKEVRELIREKEPKGSEVLFLTNQEGSASVAISRDRHAILAMVTVEVGKEKFYIGLPANNPT